MLNRFPFALQVTTVTPANITLEDSPQGEPGSVATLLTAEGVEVNMKVRCVSISRVIAMNFVDSDFSIHEGTYVTMFERATTCLFLTFATFIYSSNVSVNEW